MKLFANIKSFAANESGAVTVDWVVLTAAIVGLGIAVIASVRTGTSSLAGSIQTSLTSASVASLGTLGVNQ
jgi:Flp pilus assembly pilin Flp